MRYTPRQIAIRAREAAALLLATLDHEAWVSRFLNSYAKEHNRAGVISQPAFYRELMGTVRREAILAMVTHLDAVLPRRLGIAAQAATPPPTAAKKSNTKKKKLGARGSAKKTRAASAAKNAARANAADEAILDLFREEFFVALGQALRWGESDFGEFARDYDLYQSIISRHRTERGATLRSSGRVGAAAGPFVDRCGLLVDPSMLEQARRAAGRFQTQLEGITDGVLKKVFSARREN